MMTEIQGIWVAYWLALIVIYAFGMGKLIEFKSIRLAKAHSKVCVCVRARVRSFVCPLVLWFVHQKINATINKKKWLCGPNGYTVSSSTCKWICDGILVVFDILRILLREFANDIIFYRVRGIYSWCHSLSFCGHICWLVFKKKHINTHRLKSNWKCKPSAASWIFSANN